MNSIPSCLKNNLARVHEKNNKCYGCILLHLQVCPIVVLRVLCFAISTVLPNSFAIFCFLSPIVLLYFAMLTGLPNSLFLYFLFEQVWEIV